jgi:hypothetical protein
MKNGKDSLFIVNKSFVLGGQIVVMKGDVLKFISTENDGGVVDIYFEVVNSFWCDGMECNLTSQQVAEYLVYKVTFI